MAFSNEKLQSAGRLRIVLISMMSMFAFLFVVLWRIQVLHAFRYQTSFNQQSVRMLRIPGWRGRVFDRNGICLADNRPSYCLAIYVEELRQAGALSRTLDKIEGVIDELSHYLDLKPMVSRAQIARHVQSRRPLPFIIWRDLDETRLARWAEAGMAFPGVDIHVEPVRVYPQGRLAAHVLGHVGRADRRSEEGQEYDYYLPEMEGKRGVERTFNDVLEGQAGGRLIVVDASGFKHEATEVREPEAGQNLVLTLDVRIQRAVETVLQGERGAGVVLDPRNGDVLALSSSPGFNPNTFHPHMTPATWKALLDDPRRPLLNRAVSGVYPPGSVFKPLVAIAALENNKATANTAFDCPGYFAIGGLRIRCWNSREGHGHPTMIKAIEQSCNPYFCQLGLRCGYDRIYHMAAALGFGERTGIDVTHELRGLLPSRRWKMRRYGGGGWSAGDTCNVSIGQGALLVTPIQMAMFTATLANGGTVYRPRLTQGPAGPGGDVVNKAHWQRETLRVLREGMHAVIHAPNGTGSRARISGVEMAGKTGTAQYGRKADNKKHTWMIVFAPFSTPRYAVTLLIEDGLSGGRTVAPRMRVLMEEIFRIEQQSLQLPAAGEA
jgi:penicillin-binding protein 2